MEDLLAQLRSQADSLKEDLHSLLAEERFALGAASMIRTSSCWFRIRRNFLLPTTPPRSKGRAMSG